MKLTANITQLTDTLWTGGDLPDNDDEAIDHIGQWQHLGIATIIDCRWEWTDKDLVADVAPTITYFEHGVDDAGQHIPGIWFDELLATAESTAPGAGTLVHCHMGMNRGPSGAYSVLLANGFDPVAAIDLIRLRRPIASVAYAEDALRWWHDRNNTVEPRRRDDIARLAAWRSANAKRIVRRLRSP